MTRLIHIIHITPSLTHSRTDPLTCTWRTIHLLTVYLVVDEVVREVGGAEALGEGELSAREEPKGGRRRGVLRRCTKGGEGGEGGEGGGAG